MVSKAHDVKVVWVPTHLTPGLLAPERRPIVVRPSTAARSAQGLGEARGRQHDRRLLTLPAAAGALDPAGDAHPAGLELLHPQLLPEVARAPAADSLAGLGGHGGSELLGLGAAHHALLHGALDQPG